MKIPTTDDIYRLAQNSPALYNALMLHKRGDITFEQALMLAVALTTEELRLTRERLEELVARWPGPVKL